MGQKILTIIIPSYNAEKYVNRVVKSLLAPDCMEELEILIVNDGSLDQTREISEVYEKEYPGTVRVINKENGGHGSAINVGSRLASGKYFKVIDADDWIQTENLKPYMQLLKIVEADVVLTPFHEIEEADGSISSFFIQTPVELYDRFYNLQDIVEQWKYFHNFTLFHAVTYRTEFYNANRHELTEKVFYEDMEYAAIPFCRAQKIYLSDLYMYEYRIGGADQSMSNENRIKRLKHSEMVTEAMMTYYRDNDLSECGRQYLLNKLNLMANGHFRTLFITCKEKEIVKPAAERYCTLIKENLPELWKSQRKNCRIYQAMGMLGINDNAYKKMINSSVYKLIRKR